MRGQWVPEHLGLTMETHKAETLAQLLRAVDEDEGFPLNEMEQEIVDELVRLIEERGSTSVSR